MSSTPVATSPVATETIIPDLTDEQMEALKTALAALATDAPTNTTPVDAVKGFLTRHRTALVVTASVALAGVIGLIASQHKDELHDVIDALPETE